ncbi:MAG: hypothetical protein H6R21_2610, partial [Proteobacteria bacterium]|nr:hypothetical protein [Pseudomonadota bacterium]
MKYVLIDMSGKRVDCIDTYKSSPHVR